MSRDVSNKITYKPYSQNEQWLLPPSLDELVPENHFVRVVSRTVDELRIEEVFARKYKRRRSKQIQSSHAFESINLLLHDRNLFITNDSQTVPRKCKCHVAHRIPETRLQDNQQIPQRET